MWCYSYRVIQIHQPSTQLFRAFDNLLLLRRGTCSLHPLLFALATPSQLSVTFSSTGMVADPPPARPRPHVRMCIEPCLPACVSVALPPLGGSTVFFGPLGFEVRGSRTTGRTDACSVRSRLHPPGRLRGSCIMVVVGAAWRDAVREPDWVPGGHPRHPQDPGRRQPRHLDARYVMYNMLVVAVLVLLLLPPSASHQPHPSRPCLPFTPCCHRLLRV